MATLTQNNVLFTLNADVVAPFTGRYTNVNNFDTSTGLYNVIQAKLDNVGVDKSVNAVEIDWNKAHFDVYDTSIHAESQNVHNPESGTPYVVVSTTGDLIQLLATELKQLNKRLEANETLLATELKQLNERLEANETLLATELKQLNERLEANETLLSYLIDNSNNDSNIVEESI